MENFDKKIVEFMINEENRDDIEYVYLYSIGEYGWHRLVVAMWYIFTSISFSGRVWKSIAKYFE